jgi:P-type Ca2+ transporter type 2C
MPRSFATMHSRSPSTGNFSTVSGKSPFSGRSRATSEATLAPPGTSAGASTHSGVSGASAYTLEGYVRTFVKLYRGGG